MITDWKPYPHQELALKSTAYEVMFGGSRGPGKTDCGIAWCTYDIDNPLLRVLVIRKNADDLSDWIDRAGRMYKLLGAEIVGKPPIIRFPSGAVIKTGHLKDDQAYTKYQGHEYQRILIEELTQISTEKRYLQLISSCRSTVPNLKPQVFCTTNPGGIGHVWVKSRFVDPGVPGEEFIDKTSGRTRIFIPATVDNNPALMKNDPDYIKFLDSLKDTDEELWKAWRLGSWETFAGQFFKEFRRDLHVIPRLRIKPELPKYGGLDWGRTAPFACLFSTMIKVPWEGKHFNRLITFKEIYGTEKKPEEWAKIIKENIDMDEVSWIKADPSIFGKQNDGGISIADQFNMYGVHTTPASNDRIAGWVLMHNWLSIAPDGLPYWLITENCTNLIRTIPEMIHDENHVEDIDCFVAGTKIRTIDGNKNIEDITDKDRVLTPIGYRKPYIVGDPKKSKIITVSLSNGNKLTGTANHKVFVQGKGLVELINLKRDDILMSWNTPNTRPISALYTMAWNIENTMDEDITNQMGHLSPKDTRHFTNKFGSIIMGIFRLAIKYITRIMILIIMTPTISRLLLGKNTQNYITQSDITMENLVRNSECGETPKREKIHLKKMRIKCMKELLSGNYRAIIVKELLRRDTQQRNSAQLPVREKWNKQKNVSSVTKKQHGKTQPVRIVAVGNLEEGIVYRLRVSQAHLYYANDVLVTNTELEDHSEDAVRYCMAHLKWIDAKVGGTHGTLQRKNYKTIRPPTPLNLDLFAKAKV